MNSSDAQFPEATVNLYPKTRILVGIGEARWTSTPGQVLVARSIGSSGALALWDPFGTAGGMLHWLVPDADCDPERAISRPGLFADTGIPLLLRGMESLGADLENLQAVLAGAASLREGGEMDVGARNRETAYGCLKRNGIHVTREETGGFCVRELSLEIGSGRTCIRCQQL